MVCHEFKGGIGTSSRVIPDDRGGFTVGALVQANYGKREWLRVDGVPVGAEIGPTRCRARTTERRVGPRHAAARLGFDHRRRRRRMRRCSPTSASGSPSGPASGIARAGGTGGHTSGDLFIAFATGNRLPLDEEDRPDRLVHDVRAVGDGVIDALFDGAIEATEEAIVNALVAAETMTGATGSPRTRCPTTACSRS